MTGFTKLLAGGVAAAALIGAAPAAAQYYPGYGYGYGTGGVVGSIINGVLGGGYGGYGSGYGYSPYGYGGYSGYSGYGGYGGNSQALVSQCVSAVQARLGRNSYSGYGYGGYGYAGGRVLGISRIEPRGDGGLRIRGVATSGMSGAPDLTFSCKTDYRGFIRDVDVDRASGGYGYGYSTYNPYDYSQYGYRRY